MIPDRKPEIYIGLIEEIICSGTKVSDEAFYFIRDILPRLQKGYYPKMFEIKQIESVYAFTCR